MYEKEVRRARKEAFKSSSALVKLQEELKTARNRYTLMRVEAESERQKSIVKEIESSAAQQQLVMMKEELNALRQHGLDAKERNSPGAQQGLEAVEEEFKKLEQQKTTSSGHDPVNAENELRELSEELFMLQQKLSKAERMVEKAEMQKQVVEEERDALKQSMEEDQVVRSAAQGAIALPPPTEGDGATYGSPRKSSHHDAEKPKRDIDYAEELLEDIADGDVLSQLRHELHWEKRMRLEAEEQAHLSLMECQFGCCSCRVAEKQGTAFVHDNSLAKEITELVSGRSSKGKGIPAKMIIPERPRSHQGPSRSATPKLAMPQRPLSQQAQARQATPKLLERPHSQQAESRRITPRLQQHNRSVTETTFRTARELDLQARRSISQARNPSATPLSPATSRQLSEKLIDPVLKAENGNEQADADKERMLETNFSPHPEPPITKNAAHPVLPPPSPEDIHPLSPTMDFNFTEIIPNIPSFARPLPTPPPVTRAPSQPTACQDHPITASTTTRVPVKDDAPELFSPAPDTPGGISREEALEQIRARRGRAKSYAASHGAPTPRKGITGTPRREISAPAIRKL